MRSWLLVPLLVGCGGKNADDSGLNAPSEHYPEGGWTIDACHNDLVSHWYKLSRPIVAPSDRRWHILHTKVA